MAQTLLIVSDSISLTRMLSITLKGAGHDSVESCCAAGLPDRLDRGKVHLILVDMDMAAVDGLTVVEQIRRVPACRFTPIITLAADRDHLTEQRGRELGVKHWLAKPFQPPHLLVMVSRLILD